MSDGERSIQFQDDGGDDSESIQFQEDLDGTQRSSQATGRRSRAQSLVRQSRVSSTARAAVCDDDEDSIRFQAEDNDSVSSAPGGSWFVTKPNNTSGDEAAAGPIAVVQPTDRRKLPRKMSVSSHVTESVVDNGSIAFQIEDLPAALSPRGGPASAASMDNHTAGNKKTVVSAVLRERGGSVARQMKLQATLSKIEQLDAASDEVDTKRIPSAAKVATTNAKDTKVVVGNTALADGNHEGTMDFPKMRTSNALSAAVPLNAPQPATTADGGTAACTPAHPRTSSKQLVLQHLREQEVSNEFVQKAAQHHPKQAPLVLPPTSSVIATSTYRVIQQHHTVAETAITYPGYNLSMINSEDLAAARDETFFYHAYNRTQRAALQDVEKRVMTARRENEQQLPHNANEKREPLRAGRAAPQAAVVLSYPRAKRVPSSIHPKKNEMRNAVNELLKMSEDIHRRRSPNSGGAQNVSRTKSAEVRRQPPGNSYSVIEAMPVKPQGISGHALLMRASPRKEVPTRAVPTRRPHVVSHTAVAADYLKQVKKYHCDAYAQTAASFGILWPPSELDCLYFVSGVRLTQRQVSQFFCSAESLHQSIHNGATNEISNKQSATEKKCDIVNMLSADVATKAISVPGRKKTSKRTRTHILREVFSMLDVGSRGVLCQAAFPSLRGAVLQEIVDAQCTMPNAKLQPPTPSLTTGEARHIKLCELAADVAIPLLIENGALEVDFPLFSMIVLQRLDSDKAGGNTGVNKTGSVWFHYVTSLFDVVA